MIQWNELYPYLLLHSVEVDVLYCFLQMFITHPNLRRWTVCDDPYYVTLHQDALWVSCGGANFAGVAKYTIGNSNGQVVISESRRNFYFGKTGTNALHYNSLNNFFTVFYDTYFYVPLFSSRLIQQVDTATGAVLQSTFLSGKEYWAMAKVITPFTSIT